MKNQETDLLLLKCLDGSATAGDYVTAWHWIQQSEQNKRYYEGLRDSWLASSIIQHTDERNVMQKWVRFKARNVFPQDLSDPSVRKTGSSGILFRTVKVAAALILTFALGGITFNKLRNPAEAGDQITYTYLVEAPRGAKSFVTLPDSSKIWLNAGSKISYQSDYNRNNRDIFLEGEAYFTVARNKHLSFCVYSSGIAIKALGTSFNVKAYPDEDIIETTLVEGKISIESTNRTGKIDKILMKPNQKASFYKVTEHLDLESANKKNDGSPSRMESKFARVEVDKKIDTEIYTSWKDKRWVFKTQKMTDFAKMLERLYDIRICFKDEELKNYSLSGSFDEENLEQVLKAVQLTVPMDFTIVHKEVIFSINEELKNNYNKILKPSANEN